jgi:hypothetical protein
LLVFSEEVLGVRTMRLMVVLSLLINVAVLMPVCAGLLTTATLMCLWRGGALGGSTDDRLAQ